jgi:hypothetical protein
MSSTPQSLVIGAYTKLPSFHLEPFVRSLRSTGFQGDLAIVAGGIGEVQRAELDALADDVWHVDAEYDDVPAVPVAVLRFVRKTRGLRRAYDPMFRLIAGSPSGRDAFRRWSSFEFQLEGLQSLRYLHYYRYIALRSPPPDFVMITDLRDVMFQRDPFEDPVRGLEVYAEDGSVRIGNDVFNTRWLRDLVESAELEKMIGAPVFCSGTVIGTRDAMLSYLFEMAIEIVWRRRPMGSHDQGVHNILIHGERLAQAARIPNEHGRVLTLGAMETFETDSIGRVRNRDGSIPAVLHQWDRHASLASKLASSTDASQTVRA